MIALNQFADVFNSAVEGVAAALNTETKGIPLVVFNPLNIPREDVVEATVEFPSGIPKASAGDWLQMGRRFRPRFPVARSFSWPVCPRSDTPSTMFSPLRQGWFLHRPCGCRRMDLENAYYRVRLNQDGDVASIFDKENGRELLSAPARLAISYDNPAQWPAWNMDWEQEQAAPKAYVSGPAQIRVVEDGPARVAIEVTRETAGSHFVQTISLSAGDGGKRVEFGNVIDWKTRESNLKATFPLTASNLMATYNWDIGTIDRPTASQRNSKCRPINGST